MKTEVRTVTPEIAKEMLRYNLQNRTVSETHVKFLSSQMIKGDWLFDAQPLRFSMNDVLLDGQHRLNAVIESETSQKFLIITGVDNDAFKVMDTGRNRNGADALSIKRIPNAAATASAIGIILRHKIGINDLDSKGTNKVSNSDIVEFYDANESISELVRSSGGLYSDFNRVMPLSQITAYRFLMGETTILKADQFWNEVCRGLGLVKNSPTRALRQKLINNKMNKTKLAPRDIKAVIVKSWNAFLLGKEVRSLRWDSNTEKFPKMM